MTLEDLRQKVLYQNSIEIWIGISEEKNIRNYKVNTSHLPKGVYIIKLERSVSKFVKE